MNTGGNAETVKQLLAPIHFIAKAPNLAECYIKPCGGGSKVQPISQEASPHLGKAVGGGTPLWLKSSRGTGTCVTEGALIGPFTPAKFYVTIFHNQRTFLSHFKLELLW